MAANCCTCGKKKNSQGEAKKCPNKDKVKCPEKIKEKCDDEPQEGCPEFKNPKRLLSKRVHRVKCFAEMMSDERCFIRFCKRLHIVIGTCLYTWILMLACLLESIDWTQMIKAFVCSIKQNSSLESMLDGLRLVECKLICCMAAPYKPGALWHYFLIIILLPIIGTIQLVSLKVAILLKIKSLFFGEREQCPEDEPRQIYTPQCTCVAEDYVTPVKNRASTDSSGSAAGAGSIGAGSDKAAEDAARTSAQPAVPSPRASAEAPRASVEAAPAPAEAE